MLHCRLSGIVALARFRSSVGIISQIQKLAVIIGNCKVSLLLNPGCGRNKESDCALRHVAFVTLQLPSLNFLQTTVLMVDGLLASVILLKSLH